MRVFDRLTAVVVALAFVLVGLGAPAHREIPGPGAVVTAAQRPIIHDAPSVLPPDGRAVRQLQLGASDAAPWPGAVVRQLQLGVSDAAPLAGVLVRQLRPGGSDAIPDAPPDVRTELFGGDLGDHRAGVVSTDGPDDLLPAPAARVGGTPDPGAAAPRYRSPAVPLPRRGTLPTRAPPALA